MDQTSQLLRRERKYHAIDALMAITAKQTTRIAVTCEGAPESKKTGVCGGGSGFGSLLQVLGAK